MSQGSPNPTIQKVFGGASFFSPLLFGKFFDPSDAFPLWEFESDILLSGLRSAGQNTIDWFQTDQDYVLKVELPGKVFQLLLIYLFSEIRLLNFLIMIVGFSSLIFF